MLKVRNLLYFEQLCNFKEVVHFTTTRHGGVSKGAFSSLNGSPFSGDEMSNVLENQHRICQNLSSRSMPIVMPYQNHGTTIMVVDEALMLLPAEERAAKLHGVDGLITSLQGVLIAVSTADCVPIVLYDPVLQIVGVVHAGWRGTVDRIVEKAVRTMIDQLGSDPATLCAGIAPSISVDAFEVGDEVYAHFDQAGFPMAHIAQRSKCNDKWHLDLWKANIWLMERVGMDRSKIECAEICTFNHHHDFFSARRLSINSGRNITGIGLKKESTI